MKSFNSFLIESLTEPQEFYITDDTKIPMRFVSAYDYDGETYGISLEQTNFSKVYLLDFYRVSSATKRHWAFKKSIHVKPGLATILKFIESSIPFMKTKMDGIIIRLPKKAEMRNFEKLTRMMINKTYINSMRVIPTEESGEKGNAYIFIARKTVSPTVLFKSKEFKKYKMEGGIITQEALNDVETKKPIKPTVNLKPSLKYSFKGFDVTTADAGEDLYDKISNIKEVKVEKKEDPTGKEPQPYQVSSWNFRYILAGKMTDMTMKIIKNGFNQEMFNKNNFKHVFNTFINTVEYEPLRAWMQNMGYLDAFSDITPNGWKFIENQLMKLDQDYKQKKIETAEKVSKYFANVYDYAQEFDDYKKAKTSSEDFGEDDTTYKSDIDFLALKKTITIPGHTHEYVQTKDYKFGKEVGEDAEEKAKYISNSYGMDYYDEIQNNLTEDERYVVQKYTGSSYDSFNNPLRNVGKVLSLGKSIDDITESEKYAFKEQFKTKIDPMMKTFSKIKPLPEPIVVFRGAYIPQNQIDSLKVGNDYIDPAFLSTSIRSTMSFGLNNIKFEIFCPKGSNVMPILNHSYHDHEQEVILPAMTVQKIVEFRTWKEDGKSYFYVKTIMVGSVYDSFMGKHVNDLLKENYIMNEETKKDKEKTYDPHGKFGGKYPDSKFMKTISKNIKSGKIKFNKKKK